MAEHPTHNRKAAGSSPAGSIKKGGKLPKRAVRKGDRIMIRKVLRPGQLPCRDAGRKGEVMSTKLRPLIHVRLDNGTTGTVLEGCLVPVKGVRK